ncbi:hypothetical protein H9W90_01455 [Polaribacter pectinis]|uniref:Uncharacterized protein n=1 Tax=Polaribacter pectinis TaxID=2738844 RepID=A0A7G9LB15_9FLAO|nr:hypothetical protein [Polaribacter pectinis]QNM85814.1 hypothetical protein H9W90_01455 [Polaribacter pectinis]
MKTISTINIKDNTLKLNDFALESTEKAVLKTINTTEDLQKFTAKKLKSTLSFTAKQQENFFNKAENVKSLVWKKINKTVDFFSKN